MTAMTPLMPTAALRAAHRDARRARAALDQAHRELNPARAIEAWNQAVETNRRIARIRKILGGTR